MIGLLTKYKGYYTIPKDFKQNMLIKTVMIGLMSCYINYSKILDTNPYITFLIDIPNYFGLTMNENWKKFVENDLKDLINQEKNGATLVMVYNLATKEYFYQALLCFFKCCLRKFLEDNRKSPKILLDSKTIEAVLEERKQTIENFVEKTVEKSEEDFIKSGLDPFLSQILGLAFRVNITIERTVIHINIKYKIE